MSYRVSAVPFVFTRRQRLATALIAHGAGVASALCAYALAARISQLDVELSIWLAGAFVAAVAGMLAAAVSLRVARF